jgi:NAD(P)-dependent dehydrogenase (short-subunit alcohol dehydrogenase family)
MGLLSNLMSEIFSHASTTVAAAGGASAAPAAAPAPAAAGMIAESGISAYVVAKHGVIGLTKAAAMEYAAHGIRINALAPGLVETAMTKAWFDDPNIR